MKGKQPAYSEQLLLAWIVLRHDTPPPYCSRPLPVVLYSYRQRQGARHLSDGGYLSLSKDVDKDLVAAPTELGRKMAARFRTASPGDQLTLWLVRPPQLQTLANFINKEMDGYLAVLDDGFTSTGRKHGRLRSPGRGRTGKRLRVYHSRDLTWAVHENDKSVPYARNLSTVEWAAARIPGLKLLRP